MHWKSGDIIEIAPCAKVTTKYRFLVDMKSDVMFTLAPVNQPYKRLHFKQYDHIEYDYSISKTSMLSLEKNDNGYLLRSNIKANNDVLYLAVKTNDGSLTCGHINDSMITSYFNIEIISDDNKEDQQMSYKPERELSENVLRPFHIERLYREGYVQISDVVDKRRIFNCQKVLMHNLGKPGALHPGGAQTGLGKLGGNLSNAPEIRALLEDKLLHILESLLGGQGEIDGVENGGNLSGQIALRFPEYLSECEHRTVRDIRWHTDGLRQGRTHSFSVLVGVCLSDCLEDYAGNLLVWPTTHIPIHRATVGKHGAINAELLSEFVTENVNTQSNRWIDSKSHDLDTRRVEDLLLSSSMSLWFTYENIKHVYNNYHMTEPVKDNGGDNISNESAKEFGNPKPPKSECDIIEPPNKHHHDNEPDNLPFLGIPVQVKAKAGDVIILHPDTAHTGGPNYSCNIRSMVYFRIKCKKHRLNDAEYTSNMWVDFAGIDRWIKSYSNNRLPCTLNYES